MNILFQQDTHQFHELSLDLKLYNPPVHVLFGVFSFLDSQNGKADTTLDHTHTKIHVPFDCPTNTLNDIAYSQRLKPKVT